MSAEDYIPFPIDFDEDDERAREAYGEDSVAYYKASNSKYKMPLSLFDPVDEDYDDIPF